MDVKDLKCFVTVYEEQSINKAAGRLFITAQGLGKIIQKLEEELKTTLFERSKKGVVPTESAEFLYGKATEILRLSAEIERGIYQLSKQHDTLRLACARGVLNALSFSLILDFIKQYPNIHVTWEEYSNQEVKERVESMQADVGIVVGRTEMDQILERKIAARDIRLIVYEGHPFYDRESVSVEELKDQKIIILNEQFQVFHTFQKICDACGYQPDIVAKTVDSSFIYQLCKGGLGIGIVIDFSTEHFLMEGVRVVPLHEKISWDIYRICNKQSAEYENIQLFDQYLNEWL